MATTRTVIVLAAGGGTRFIADSHKLAARFSGEASVLATTLGQAIASHLHVVVVTTEPFADLARQSVAARDVVVVPEVGDTGSPGLGMGYSISAGVSARPHAAGWLILPGDMPLVQPSTLVAVARLLDHHAVVYAQHRGKRGHPVGFGPELYSELVALSGDEGARRLIARYPAFGVELDDPGILIDIDTEDDLESARRAAPPALRAADGVRP
ncbi:MAG: nucleotidyltransferase family protein [Burkholderiales bacterium]|nr:nucleotidyltransferase family protein [Burkholderiales bacterium]